MTSCTIGVTLLQKLYADRVQEQITAEMIFVKWKEDNAWISKFLTK